MARKEAIEYVRENNRRMDRSCITVNDLLQEYVELYGKARWSYSTYSENLSVLEHYVRPVIGLVKVEEITPRFLNRYYQDLLAMKSVKKHPDGAERNVPHSAVLRIHKLLRSCFTQAVRWELIDRNPVALAQVPKAGYQEKRKMWDAETVYRAISLCETPSLRLAMHLAFSCSLRLGEILGLTWDCIDLSDHSIHLHSASIMVNKTLQRVSMSALRALNSRDIITCFPKRADDAKSVLVLKAPKTETSIRKVFLPDTVTQMLVSWKSSQDIMRETLASEYHDYNLVFANDLGLPSDPGTVTEHFSKLIAANSLPKVVFHSLRHSSITYKLKLSNGDVKAVQGDSGHAQASMVTDHYSHILDDDRRTNACLFEEFFYSAGRRKAGPESEDDILKDSDADLSDITRLRRILKNPEAAAIIKVLESMLGRSY